MKVTELDGKVFWITLAETDVPYADADSLEFELTREGLEVACSIDWDGRWGWRGNVINTAELDRLIHNLLILREKMENM